jgi:hypothetical protein
MVAVNNLSKIEEAAKAVIAKGNFDMEWASMETIVALAALVRQCRETLQYLDSNFDLPVAAQKEIDVRLAAIQEFDDHE